VLWYRGRIAGQHPLVLNLPADGFWCIGEVIDNFKTLCALAEMFFLQFDYPVVYALLG
jgi:hypothetical protein